MTRVDMNSHFEQQQKYPPCSDLGTRGTLERWFPSPGREQTLLLLTATASLFSSKTLFLASSVCPRQTGLCVHGGGWPTMVCSRVQVGGPGLRVCMRVCVCGCACACARGCTPGPCPRSQALWVLWSPPSRGCRCSKKVDALSPGAT